MVTWLYQKKNDHKFFTGWRRGTGWPLGTSSCDTIDASDSYSSLLCSIWLVALQNHWRTFVVDRQAQRLSKAFRVRFKKTRKHLLHSTFRSWCKCSSSSVKFKSFTDRKQRLLIHCLWHGFGRRIYRHPNQHATQTKWTTGHELRKEGINVDNS